MSKILKCSDVGQNCDFVARGADENEVLGHAAEHAHTAHGMETIPPEAMPTIKAAIRDE